MRIPPRWRLPFVAAIAVAVVGAVATPIALSTRGDDQPPGHAIASSATPNPSSAKGLETFRAEAALKLACKDGRPEVSRWLLSASAVPAVDIDTIFIQGEPGLFEDGCHVYFGPQNGTQYARYSSKPNPEWSAWLPEEYAPNPYASSAIHWPRSLYVRPGEAGLVLFDSPQLSVGQPLVFHGGPTRGSGYYGPPHGIPALPRTS